MWVCDPRHPNDIAFLSILIDHSPGWWCWSLKYLLPNNALSVVVTYESKFQATNSQGQFCCLLSQCLSLIFRILLTTTYKSGWNIEMRSFNSTFSWLSNSGKFTAGWFNSATILWLSAMSETDCHLELKTGYIISLVRNKTQPAPPALPSEWRD